MVAAHFEEDILSGAIVLPQRLCPKFLGCQRPQGRSHVGGFDVASIQPTPKATRNLGTDRSGARTLLHERLEVLHPSDDIPLPTAATNGVMSLTRRKTLLKDLTGSDSGWTLNHRIELTRDWLEVLSAWQLTAKET